MGNARLPQAPSVGEATLALHLKANKIPFEREVCLVPGRKFRTDFLLREPRIAIEVEGGIWKFGRHQRALTFERDMIKYNAISSAGYTLLRFTTDQVKRGEAINHIMQTLDASCTQEGR